MSLRTFSGEAFKDFHTTASVVPSSRFLTRAMLAPLPLARARRVVEFGPGTGVITEALLEALPAQATLFSFEVNPRFCAYLRRTFPDPRLKVVAVSAERACQELGARGVGQVDAVVSSLGLTLMSARRCHAILQGMRACLAPGAVLTQYQYVHGLLAPWLPVNGSREHLPVAQLLRAYFPSVTSEVIWRNLPPAFVYTCR